jgi:hypothetical protein
MKAFALGVVGLASVSLVAPMAHAHFKLLQPTSWIIENDRGDPQKVAPCGGTGTDADKLTDAVTKLQGGSTLHIKVMETIYHPGFYRVALAVNSRTELPADPEAITVPSDKGPRSVAAKIVYPPQMPVLADGLFQHTSKATDAWETDVVLPNITCTKCTLQVVQFMAQHGLNKPGDYTYHHCADLAITADPSKPIDAAWTTAKATAPPTP